MRTVLQSAASIPAKLSLIRATTAEFFDQPQGAKSNTAIRVRMIGMYLAKELTMASGLEVAKFFGLKDHTSVLHAHRRITELSLKDDEVARAIQEIRRRLDAVAQNYTAPPTETNALYERLHRIEKLLENKIVREKLPDDREGTTLHFVITSEQDGVLTDTDGYLSTGEFGDHRLGELFLKIGKQGDQHAVYDQWCISTSVALQYGAPAVELLSKFLNSRFEPSGAVKGVEGIKRCSSPLDLVCRWLLAKYTNKIEVENATAA